MARRRAGARRRHLRGRAYAGDADTDPEEGQNMRAVVDGNGATASPQDIILAIIGEIGTAGAFQLCAGICRRRHPCALDEGRMTVYNMSIEGGARAGLIAPDERRSIPEGGSPQIAEGRRLGRRVRYWKSCARRRRAFHHGLAGRYKTAADRRGAPRPGRGLDIGRAESR